MGDAPVKGPASAPVTLVAWSDFQCPFCSRAVPTVRQLEDAYKGKLRIAFKQFPLPFHDKAHLAAEAALAANEQGKFWQMHDKLFANQQALDRASLEKYAQELGLDMGKFKAALDSGKFKDKVDAEDKEGAAFGVTGTPTFFINGTRLVGAQPFECLQSGHRQRAEGQQGLATRLRRSAGASRTAFASKKGERSAASPRGARGPPLKPLRGDVERQRARPR